LVFVISNTQNDLFEYREEVGMDYIVSMESINELCDQTDAFIGRACEFIFVTYQDRATGESARRGLTTFRLTPDATPWAGDHRQWRDLFQGYFAAGSSIPSSAARSTARSVA